MVTMQSEYDVFLTEAKQDVLATACGYAAAVWHDTLEGFFAKFKASGYMRDFERNASYVIEGCYGNELAARVYEHATGKPVISIPAPDEDDSILNYREYWAGYALGYFQGRSGLTFDEIFEKIPLKRMLELYPTLHETGDDTLFEKMLQHF